MRHLTCIIFFVIVATGAFAQQKSDSTSYAAEREKINTMLAQRAKMFGQYSQSLKMHSGIFGVQTKKHVRNSSAILMDIVKTDDDINKEITILLDFHAFQQSKAKQTEDTNLGYLAVINKLRSQIGELQAENNERQQEARRNMRLFIISLLLALLAIYLLARPKPRKA